MLTPAKIQRLLQSLLAQESFEGIAGDLQELLAHAWTTSAGQAIDAVVEYVQGIAGDFTRENLSEAIEIMDGFMGPRFAERVSPIVREAVSMSYNLAQEELRTGLSSSLNLVDRRAQAWLHQHEMYWTRTHFDRAWTERITDLADTALREGLSRADAGRFFRNTLGEKLQGETDQYWELVADAITTRSRSFGSIEAMAKADITEYRIDAVIDHRTSDICRYLDGEEITVVNDDGEPETIQLSEEDRVFRVSDAAGLRDRMIAAETPEEAKEIMGWKSPKTVLGKMPNDLAGLGIALPPFHGNCRSRIVIA